MSVGKDWLGISTVVDLASWQGLGLIDKARARYVDGI